MRKIVHSESNNFENKSVGFTKKFNPKIYFSKIGRIKFIWWKKGLKSEISTRKRHLLLDNYTWAMKQTV